MPNQKRAKPVDSSANKKQPNTLKTLDSKGQMPYTTSVRKEAYTWRQTLKLTQRQLAEELSVDERTVRRFEAGIGTPRRLFTERLEAWVEEQRAAAQMVSDGLPPQPYRPRSHG